jgi:hypothetical protein
MFLPGPAGAAAAGVLAYLIAVWIHSGADDRLTSEADYAEGYNAARRKLIEAGWRQATAPAPIESILPAELLTDMDVLMIDHEEAVRAHQAAIDRGQAVKRALLGVNACVIGLQTELAQAQIRADRAEGALQDIRDVHARYAFAPPREAPAAAPPPATAAAPLAEPPITIDQIQPAAPPAPPAPSLRSPAAARLSSSSSLSPPDDGEHLPEFLTEPRAIEIDGRKTEDALIRLRNLTERRWPLTEPPRAAAT